jgi:site-specific recombinase XerD
MCTRQKKMELKELETVFLMEFTSKATIATYKYSLNSFSAFLKSKHIENVNGISIPILKQWRNGLNLSYASRSKIVCVRSFLKWLFVNDYINKNTGKCLKMIPKPDPLVERICGKTDINDLLKLAETTHKPTALMLKLLYWTGIRLTACCTIRS